MSYDFSELKEKVRETKEWLARELSAVRTGRATPAILDNIKVDSYGAKVPVNHIAGITIEDAKTLRVAPWDKSQVSEVEKAINDAGLGVSVNSDEQGVRVGFPELTSERRDSLRKVVNAKHEEARVSLRSTRDDIWSDIQKKERSDEVSEDEKFRLKEEMQKIVDEANKELDETIERKEKELQG